jgi:hypothetical protein
LKRAPARFFICESEPRMKIGLIDVDGHNFPNLPLMKLSAFHQARGDAVEFYEPLIGWRGGYDKVYASKVFDFTPDYPYPIYAEKVVFSGTGYSLKTVLPKRVEACYPDYELYGITKTAYGFLTRGCPRSCPFCVVTPKEGNSSQKVSDLSNFWRGQKEIKLLDANLLACPDRDDLLMQLAESRAYIDFTQGLDVRLTDERVAEMIAKMKIKMRRFSWDFESESALIEGKLKEFKAATDIDFRKMRVYILTNFNTSFDFDLYRVYKTVELGYDPYIMIYGKRAAPRNVRLLQRRVNNKRIFRIIDRFEDCNPKLG